jgi:hypothetical protein
MGDLPNEIEATQIGSFRSDRVIAGKLAPGSFGVLQQYRHYSAVRCDAASHPLLKVLLTRNARAEFVSP